MKRYIKQYNDDYLAAEARADKLLGSYIYFSKTKPVRGKNVLSVEPCVGGWYVEYKREPRNIEGLEFVRRKR